MSLNKFNKHVCCSLDVTIAARIIGLIGILISVLLMTVLLNDKYFNKEENYDLSRKTALAFGLDWKHFHPQASTDHQNDREGKMISIIVIFYSVTFLIINILLAFATIKYDWRYTIPWLTCEILGCLSKFGATIYHICNDPGDLSIIFIVGSIIYIVMTIWWWMTVFSAQLSWRCKKISVLELELTTFSSHGSRESKISEENVSAVMIRFARDAEYLDSPGRYSPNKLYALI